MECSSSLVWLAKDLIPPGREVFVVVPYITARGVFLFGLNAKICKELCEFKESCLVFFYLDHSACDLYFCV